MGKCKFQFLLYCNIIRLLLFLITIFCFNPGHFEVTEILIKSGADVNANDLWAFTPLHEAASKSRVEVCSLLLSKGADPTLLNCHSKSAIDSAPTRELQERIACKLILRTLPVEVRRSDENEFKENPMRK